MDVKSCLFGILADGTEVHLYSISNGKISFSATDYGCVITSIIIPSKTGRNEDIVLGPSSFDGVVCSSSYFGAMVGRFANRIGGAKFSLNDKEYHLDSNDNGNCLHGGLFRWDKILWNSEVVETREGSGIRFSRHSPDGEQGMPGNLDVAVTYLLTMNNEIIIKYEGFCDKDTPINFTNHSYFNLKGQFDTIDTHVLSMNCSSFLEVDDSLVPTGRILSVEDTVFDFRTPKEMGKDFSSMDLEKTGGYDHCYCIDSAGGELVDFATVVEPTSGRTMTVATDLPGVQFYTGNSLGGGMGKNGNIYVGHSGFCLETQYYPDTPNKTEFPSCILKAGEKYSSTTIYAFKW